MTAVYSTTCGTLLLDQNDIFDIMCIFGFHWWPRYVAVLQTGAGREPKDKVLSPPSSIKVQIYDRQLDSKWLPAPPGSAIFGPGIVHCRFPS